MNLVNTTKNSKHASYKNTATTSLFCFIEINYCNYNNATNKTSLEEININCMDKSRQNIWITYRICWPFELYALNKVKHKNHRVITAFPTANLLRALIFTFSSLCQNDNKFLNPKIWNYKIIVCSPPSRAHSFYFCSYPCSALHPL